MDMYLTTTDHIVRSRGSFISFLCCNYFPRYVLSWFLKSWFKVWTFFLSSLGRRPMASCHALRCYMVAPTASSPWRWIIQMLSFLWRLLQFFLFKQMPTLYDNTSTQGCACPHADCQWKWQGRMCHFIGSVIAFPEFWTLFWTYRFNLTYWTYLSLHPFLIDFNWISLTWYCYMDVFCLLVIYL